jgi:ParB/RepB/Spo0J family partition protein
MKTEIVTAKPADAVLIASTSELAVGPFQPRTVFPKEAHKELTDSIKEKGVVVPILVRPHPAPKGDVLYEIVDGERRWRAAKECGQRVPVIVKELTDEQVIDIQLITSLQREDLTPIDEAEGYEKLQKKGLTAEQIAKKLGKDKGHVQRRLKLCALTPKSRKLLADGTFSVEVALQLAMKVTDPVLQDKAAKGIVERPAYEGPWTVTRVANFLQQNFMLRLADAPFDPKSADLVPSAGSCSDCPKCTSNDRTLFGDVDKADVLCTDAVCFRSKVDAMWEIHVKAAEIKGLVVLDEKKAKMIFPWNSSQLDPNCAYVDYSDAPWQDEKRRPWSTLLQKSKVKPALVRDPKGRARYVLLKTEAVAALKKCGHKFLDAEEVKVMQGGESDGQIEAKKRQHETNVGKRAAVIVMQRIAESPVKIKSLSSQDFNIFLAKIALNNARGSAMAAVIKRRGLTAGKTADGPRQTLRKLIDGMKSPGDLLGLALELLCIEYEVFSAHGGGFNQSVQEACDFFQIDLKGIVRDVRKNYGRKSKKKD